MTAPTVNVPKIASAVATVTKYDQASIEFAATFGRVLGDVAMKGVAVCRDWQGQRREIHADGDVR